MQKKKRKEKNVCSGQGLVRQLKKDCNPQRDHSSLRDNYLLEHRLQTKKKIPVFGEVLRYFFTNRAVTSVPTVKPVRVVEVSQQQIQHSAHTETDVWMIGKAFIANWSVLLLMLPSTAGVK